jgi:hypothetical protein
MNTMPTRRLSQVALDALSPAEARALTWAQEILSHAVAQDGRSIQPGEVLICPDDSTERLVGFSWNGRPTVSDHSSASSDWLPAGSEPSAPLGSGRIYPGQWEADRAWEEWDPYAQQRAAKHAAKAAKAAERGTPAPAAPASPFAALAALRTAA